MLTHFGELHISLEGNDFIIYFSTLFSEEDERITKYHLEASQHTNSLWISVSLRNYRKDNPFIALSERNAEESSVVFGFPFTSEEEKNIIAHVKPLASLRIKSYV